MRNIIKKLSGLALMIVLLLIWCIYSHENTQESTLANSGVISNTKIGWGIKRAENHAQPELGKTNLELMKKYEGICMGNNEKKYVYLTFDEGYEAGYTAKILDTLKEEKVSATFFVTAHYINTASDLIQRMIDERAYNRKSYS